MTPRACKIALREHRLILKPGSPPLHPYLTDFQKKRYKKAFHLVHLYLRRQQSSTEISHRFHRTHQRIYQILKLGIDYMLETKHIHPTKTEKKEAA